MSKNKMYKILIGLMLFASCATVSAATFDIISVLEGNDDSFKFSGIHDASGTDPMTGPVISRLLSSPVSGTYDDVSGNLDMVLSLDPIDFD